MQKRVTLLVIRLSTFCILHSAFVGDASAEIVVFKNGRTMSVKSHKIVADMATLSLRDGGEVTFPASIIERVDPDEVPFDSPDAHGDARVPPAHPSTPLGVTLSLSTGQGASAPEAYTPVDDAVLAARPFAAVIATVAEAYDVDARLVHAVIEQESNYRPRARSKKGARGLMQLMPATARQYGVKNSYDPKSNIDAGVRHLKALLSRLDLPVALAAYNAGEGAVQRYGGLPPYPETRAYVRNVLRRLGPQIKHRFGAD